MHFLVCMPEIPSTFNNKCNFFMDRKAFSRIPKIINSKTVVIKHIYAMACPRCVHRRCDSVTCHSVATVAFTLNSGVSKKPTENEEYIYIASDQYKLLSGTSQTCMHIYVNILNIVKY